MSTKNKVIIVIIATLAFVIGFYINSTRIHDDVNHSVLLSAELQQAGSKSTPDQGDFSVGKISNLLGDKLTLVNFWASWCAPCREEMPLFESVYQASESQGFQIIGIAIDSYDKAKPMLDSMGINYPILYAQQTGMDLMSSTGNPHGLLPYTLILDSNGEIVDQVLGLVNEAQIVEWLGSADIKLNLSNQH